MKENLTMTIRAKQLIARASSTPYNKLTTKDTAPLIKFIKDIEDKYKTIHRVKNRKDFYIMHKDIIYKIDSSIDIDVKSEYANYITKKTNKSFFKYLESISCKVEPIDIMKIKG